MQPKIIENFISKETSQTLHNFLKTKSYEHLPDIPHPAGIMHTSIDEKYLKSISEEKDLFIIDLINLSLFIFKISHFSFILCTSLYNKVSSLFPNLTNSALLSTAKVRGCLP